jgi:hypothetical protein
MAIQVSNLARSEFLQDLNLTESSAVVGGYSYSYSYDSTPISTIAAPFSPFISFAPVGIVTSSSIANFTTSGSTFTATPFSFGFTNTPINFSVSIPVLDTTISSAVSGSIGSISAHG